MNLTYRMVRHLKLSKKFDPLDNFLIIGDPRSGTTWLAELLSHIPKTCIVNEPLDIETNRVLRELPFGWRQPIPRDETWPAC